MTSLAFSVENILNEDDQRRRFKRPNNNNEDEEEIEAPQQPTKRPSKRKRASSPLASASKEVIACSNGYVSNRGVTVELVSQELWKKFHRLGTEMIITKAGR